MQAAYARDAGWVSYVAGLDVELTEGALKETQTNLKMIFRKISAGTHYDFEVEAQVIAPYLHAVWSLAPATDITTGLRWEMTDYDYTNNLDSATVAQGKLFLPESRQ